MAVKKQILTEVDWSPVDRVLAESNLPTWDLEDLQNMVAQAALKWLDADLKLGVHSVEAPGRDQNHPGPTTIWLRQFKDGRPLPIPLRSTYDLRLAKDGSKLVDWKTAGRADAEWVARMQQSWQWRLYLYGTGAEEFEYRGVQRDGYVRGITVKRYPGMDEAVENYLDGAIRMVQSLLDKEVWPLKRPYSCRAYGRPCPHINDCFNHDGGDKGLVNIEFVQYSTIETLLLCPERGRRSWRGDREAEGTDATAFGTVFHSAIATLYSQFDK